MVRARCVKTLIHAGKPPVPEFKDGDKLLIDFEVRKLPKDPPGEEEGGDGSYKSVPTSSLTLIEDTRVKWPQGFGQPLELVLGKKFQLPIVEQCVQTMMPGELAQFDIQPVDLAGSYEPDSWQLNADEKLSSIDSLARQGRMHFARANWVDANKAYAQAVGLGTAPRENILQQEGQMQTPHSAAKKRPDVAAPPSHLEAVPLERSGALNKNFRAELVLGADTNDHHHTGPMGHEETTDLEALIRKLHQRADTDKDGKVSKTELENVIIANINHHLDESVRDAKATFKFLDQNADGILSWDEYHYHFLIANDLMDEKLAKSHDEENHENMMHMKYSEKIAMDKDNWGRSDADGSGGLNEKEFLAFRHPEHNSAALREMVSMIISGLDQDNDNALSEAEFAQPASGMVDPKWADTEKKYVDERRREFSTFIDTDLNGSVSADELVAYMNARNPSHARRETDEIMDLCDSDGDGLLTLQELLDKKEHMHDTAVFHPERRMHEDL